jgi:hypothetical protein
VENELRGADELAGVFPVLTERHVAALRDHVSGGGRARLVVAASVAEHLRTDEGNCLDDIRDSEHVAVRRNDDEPQYGVLLREDDGAETATVSVYDDRGALRGVVTNDAEPAVSWASRTFEEYWSEATPLSA